MRKIINLYLGHDLKFDRDNKIKRVGTPVSAMRDNDLPSPVAQKNSKNQSLLPFSSVGANDEPIIEDSPAKKKLNFGVPNYLKQFH